MSLSQLINTSKVTSEPLTPKNNKIEELPNGLFKNNVNLETIKFYYNKLKFIGSTLFDGLTKLNLVYLNKNVCINKYYTKSTAITQLKEDIKAQCFNPTEIVKPRSNFLINREKVSNFLDQIMIGLMEITSGFDNFIWIKALGFDVFFELSYCGAFFVYLIDTNIIP